MSDKPKSEKDTRITEEWAIEDAVRRGYTREQGRFIFAKFAAEHPELVVMKDTRH